VAAGALAAAALYSLVAPWLASRKVDDAYAALSRGDAATALADAKEAHDLNPFSLDAFLAWAAAERAGGNDAAAGRVYTHAIAIQPDSWRPWFYRAKLLASIGGPRAALFDAQQAAKRDPLGVAGDYAKQLAATSQ
jgi:tetratricopeptide (TPR) repeat protein